MNLKEEFKEAQGWVKESLNFDINKVIIILIIVIDHYHHHNHYDHP